MKVEFQYPGAAKTGNTSNRNVSENVENLRNHVSGESASNQRDDDDATTPENAFAELKVLKKKFDALVEFTVSLTAERDSMVQRLEGTEKELLLSRRKGNQSDSQNIQKQDKIVEKKGFLKVSIHSYLPSIVLDFKQIFSLSKCPQLVMQTERGSNLNNCNFFLHFSPFQGFSLEAIVLAAFLSFIFGRYYQF